MDSIAEIESRQRHIARIQLASPLSLLVVLVSAVVATFAVKPSLLQINDDYLTILTPSGKLIGFYWLVVAVLLLGQCFLVTLASSEETKDMLAYGVGIRLSLVNVILALWVLFWSLRLFLVAEIFTFIALALAVTVWGTMTYHPASRSQPFNFLFVHVPVRMIVCVLFTVYVWHGGLLALRWYKYVGTLPNQGGHWEPHHTAHQWGAFGLTLGLAFINAGIVFAFNDIPWAISCIYLNVALAYHTVEKPPQVFITLILGAAMILVAMVSSIGWSLINRDREGAIRLDEDAEEDGGLPRTSSDVVV